MQLSWNHIFGWHWYRFSREWYSAILPLNTSVVLLTETGDAHCQLVYSASTVFVHASRFVNILVYLCLLKYWKFSFNSDLQAKYPFKKLKNCTNSSDVVCRKCWVECSVAHGEPSDIDKHLKPKKHIAFDQGAWSSKTITSRYRGCCS